MNLRDRLIAGRRWLLVVAASALVALTASGYSALFAEHGVGSNPTPAIACVQACDDPGGGG